VSAFFFVLLYYLGEQPLVADAYIAGKLVSVAIAVSASTAFWFLSHMVNYDFYVSRLFLLFGRYSSPIYLFHTIAVGISHFLLKALFSMNTVVAFLAAVLVYAGGVIVPILLTRYVFNRHPASSKIFLGVSKTE